MYSKNILVPAFHPRILIEKWIFEKSTSDAIE